MPAIPPEHFDVCIVCALPEEFDAFEKVVSERCNVSFQQSLGRKGRPYKYTTIQNAAGMSLTLHLSIPSEMGPEAMMLHLVPILEEFKPQFVAMTGICAGDRSTVKLGDLIVAERAFSYERGKVVQDKDGRIVHQHDTKTYSPDPSTLVSVRMFRAWQQAVKQFKRPISKRQQRDWLLTRLLTAPEQRIDDIPAAELIQNAPAWRKIVAEWIRSSPAVLSRERKLLDPSAVNDRYFGDEEFPFVDPEDVTVFMESMASGSAVRSDNPFELVQVPVRGAVAIDMESAPFYRLVSEQFGGTRSLVVKGVCDYADSDKDDSYHTYASEVSAAYLLCFVQENISGSVPPTPRGSEPAPPDEVPGALNCYFCSAPKDARYRQELEKQLIMLTRLKYITHWHSYDAKSGQERSEERARYLKEARIIVLLLSPDLLTDESFTGELQQAYDLYRAGQTVVIPVLLRQTNDWEQIPFGHLKLGDLQPLPHSRKFLVGNERNLDEAFATVAAHMSTLVRQLLSKDTNR